MDIPAGNALPDPYTGGAGQPAYPWRGRITVRPAPGQPGTPDQTGRGRAQVDGLRRHGRAADFAHRRRGVAYSGPAEWCFRRFILHYAHLARAAGGVEAFVIGSEMRGLTTVRDGAGTYPVRRGARRLAADVQGRSSARRPRSPTPPTGRSISATSPPTARATCYFHLDPLWAVRRHRRHRHRQLLAARRLARRHRPPRPPSRRASIYDLAYLAANIAGGEGYDWYYASAADRDAQVRTPITEAAPASPGSSASRTSAAGGATRTTTAPAASSPPRPPPGCRSPSPSGSPSWAAPPSTRAPTSPTCSSTRKARNRTCPTTPPARATTSCSAATCRPSTTRFDPDAPGYVAGANPVSSVYAGRMVDLDRLHVYTWDARPYPAFPADTDTWGDGPNWRLGHWLTGRLASAPLDATSPPSSPTTASPTTTSRPDRPRSPASSSTACCRRARPCSRSSSPSSSTRARATARSSSPTAAPAPASPTLDADALVEQRRRARRSPP